MSKAIELLAPARDLRCGIAAIDHGADAVYIGAERFGARAAAGNTMEDIRRLCVYAHRFMAKVYVTLNTMIRDDERDSLRRLVGEMCGAGVDAALVQDMGIVDICRAGGMAMHASTQADIRTAGKVRLLRDMGFSRVVLARELSLEQIAEIHRSVPGMELEAFVHGALCVSYSGLCRASEHCFGRSADRGECAQFCRMRFNLLDATGSVVVRGKHLLSLKDMCRYDYVEALLEAGVTSLKIEGRLKDASYVKNVTAAYSQRLDAVITKSGGKYARASMGRCRYTFKPDLSKTFNRGYTDYFITGERGEIWNFDTPKATGEFVGKVKDVRGTALTVAGTASFANGDGICFMNDEHELEGFRVNRVVANTLYPYKMPRGLHAGTLLFRNRDRGFESSLSHGSGVRKIAVHMALDRVPGGYGLKVRTERGVSATATVTAAYQKAEKPQRENIVRQLAKLGNTVYECVEISLSDSCSDSFIPSSTLAHLRRTAMAEIDKAFEDEYAAMKRNAMMNNETVPHPADGHLNENINDETLLVGYEEDNCKDKKKGSPLMQCRHCLRYAFGFCVRHGGVAPLWREPLRLELGDGRRFRLQFDCARCQMNIYA